MKVKQFVFFVFILVFLVSCNPYRKITFANPDELYQNKRVVKNIERYDVVVHDRENNAFLLKSPEINEETLTGILTPAPLSMIDTTEKRVGNIRNDIHVYIESEDLLSSEILEENEKIKINKSDIIKTEMFAKEDRGVLGLFGTILLVFLGIILTFVIIILLAVSSDGSDSGGSDSGGSDSGSGSTCYIATMAYGSIDAPEVILFRKFRDQSLRKWKIGRSFIKWYYANSPSFVAKHQSKKWLHNLIRFFLNGLLKFIGIFIK